MEQKTVEKFTMCPKFEKTFAILGKKWSGLIIEVLLENGPQRFVDISKKVPEVSDRLLVERLKELEKEGLVTRESSQIVNARLKYQLTDKGSDLRPVMNEIHRWSEQWLTSEECKDYFHG